MVKERPICFWSLVQAMRAARALALARAGRSSAARMAMMAITTSSSIKVKPRRPGKEFLKFMILFRNGELTLQSAPLVQAKLARPDLNRLKKLWPENRRAACLVSLISNLRLDRDVGWHPDKGLG